MSRQEDQEYSLREQVSSHLGFGWDGKFTDDQYIEMLFRDLKEMSTKAYDYYDDLKRYKGINQNLEKDNLRLQRKVKEPISVDRIEGLEEKLKGFKGGLSVAQHEEARQLLLNKPSHPSIEDHEKVVSQLEALKKAVSRNKIELVTKETKLLLLLDRVKKLEKLEEKVAELEKKPFINRIYDTDNRIYFECEKEGVETLIDINK